jgi:hypothetical protein
MTKKQIEDIRYWEDEDGWPWLRLFHKEFGLVDIIVEQKPGMVNDEGLIYLGPGFVNRVPVQDADGDKVRGFTRDKEILREYKKWRRWLDRKARKARRQ